MASGDRPRVLLVDDALVIRSLITKVLESADYQVVGDCGNGRDAIEMAEKLRPDIILMDVTMPIMNGIEATQQITERLPDIDVVILSAMGNDRSMYAGLAAGARDYLVKPVKSKDILEVLEKLTRQRSARRQVSDEQGGLPGRGLWSFCGPTGGGDGRTTLVLSLANELLAMGKRVVLFDADLVFGDAGFYLRVNGDAPDVSELLTLPDMQPQFVRERLFEHPSGLRVVGRSAKGRPFFEGTATQLIALAHALKQVADYVLVDLPAGVPDSLLPLLDDSRYVFPVACDRPERLKNFETMLEVLGLCGFEAPRLCPLLTRSAKRVETLGVQEAFPEDAAAVELAHREAMPVTRVAPRSPYTQRVREFLGRLLKVPVQAGGGGILGGFLQRLRGR